MKPQVFVRPVALADYPQWRVLWDGYNAFYGRSGQTSLDEAVTAQTWKWFFEPDLGLRAFVAEMNGQVAGLVHCVFHRSTSRLRDVCYLQDLFTSEGYRGNGVGRALMEQVIDDARQSGSSRVYWTTQATNMAGRALYDKLAAYGGFIVYAYEM